VPRPFESVVGAAAHLDVLDRCVAADGVRLHVVELDAARRPAFRSVWRNESASPLIPSKHRALD